MRTTFLDENKGEVGSHASGTFADDWDDYIVKTEMLLAVGEFCHHKPAGTEIRIAFTRDDIREEVTPIADLIAQQQEQRNNPSLFSKELEVLERINQLLQTQKPSNDVRPGTLPDTNHDDLKHG